jgi:hypothetical protein
MHRLDREQRGGFTLPLCRRRATRLWSGLFIRDSKALAERVDWLDRHHNGQQADKSCWDSGQGYREQGTRATMEAA